MGHQYVLRELCAQAHLRGMRSLAVTFTVHPQYVISATHVPLLTSPNERRERILKCGVDEVAMLDFSTLRHLTAEQFMRLLAEREGVSSLLLGYNHRFGSDRLTDFADYEAAGKKAGVELLRLSELQATAGSNPESHQKVSSTVIRRLLLSGDIETANSLLGYCYSLSGTVVHGRGIGRQLGFPTANIRPACPDKLIPENGVYEAYCSLPPSVNGQLVEGNEHDETIKRQLPEIILEKLAVLNIGTNPTVGGQERTLEAHLIDFSGDLYGQTLQLCLKRKIRDEHQFASVDELRRQISRDIKSLSQ